MASFASANVARKAATNLSRLVLTNRTRATALVPKSYAQKFQGGAKNTATGAKPGGAGEFVRAAPTGSKARAPKGMDFGWGRGKSQIKSTGGVPARY